jgi:hypothetical protein
MGNGWRLRDFMAVGLSDNHTERKNTPLWSGLIAYFPDALIEVAKVSFDGNEQHNPGQPVHWAKGKSTDHLDCLIRHAMGAGTTDTDGRKHMGKAAWRALARLQMEIEAERAGMSYDDYIDYLKTQEGK